ncbi:MAG: hypothetical protein U0263_05330 [Polyangiaceae bacterium]
MTEHVVQSDSAIPPPSAPPFVSALKEGRERFLSHVVVHGLEIGRRTAADFLRHFGPEAIMQGLERAPELRAEILTPTTGTKPKVALRKSWQGAAEDLRIAIEVGATDASEVVAIFPPDERVRYLDAKRLWAYVVEGEFWKATETARQEAARSHVAFMMCQGLRDGLIHHQDIVEGIGVGELASRLPRADLARVIEGALSRGHRSLPYTERNLLEDMPPERLVGHVPLPHIWQTVVEDRIARNHGYLSGPEEPSGAIEKPSAPPDSVEKGWSNVPPASGRSSGKRSSKRPRGSR